MPYVLITANNLANVIDWPLKKVLRIPRYKLPLYRFGNQNLYRLKDVLELVENESDIELLYEFEEEEDS